MWERGRRDRSFSHRSPGCPFFFSYNKRTITTHTLVAYGYIERSSRALRFRESDLGPGGFTGLEPAFAPRSPVAPFFFVADGSGQVSSSKETHKLRSGIRILKGPPHSLVGVRANK